jgi:hypothetical protein
VPLLPLPLQRTWSVGDLLVAANFNSNIRDAVNFLLNPPLFLGNQTAPQSIPNNAWTDVAIDTNIDDTYSGHSVVTNNARYVAVVAGWYDVLVQPNFIGNATGSRGASMAVNGVATAVTQPSAVVPAAGAATTTVVQASGRVFLNVGDYVTGRAFQTSGGALALTAGGSRLEVGWVHA